MKPLAIVKLGTTERSIVPRRGDFEDWFRAGLGLADGEATLARPYEGDPLPDPGSITGAVLTGSSAMITDEADWSLATERWLVEILERGRPVLGVCYGHQALARALGGRAGWNPRGREIGTVEVELCEAAAEDALLGALPPTLVVQASHSQSVVALPPGARRLARNAHDEHQAFAFGESAWGVQFHPEFDADVVRGYLESRRAELAAEGIDAGERIASARDSGHGRAILERFARIAAERG